MKLSNLVNIGPKLEAVLVEAGVDSVDTFRKLGTVGVAYKLFLYDPDINVRLAALEGALRGVRWHNIPKEYVEEMENQLGRLIQQEEVVRF